MGREITDQWLKAWDQEVSREGFVVVEDQQDKLVKCVCVCSSISKIPVLLIISNYV